MPQVKTFSQAVSDTVTVHWPLQCQVEIPDLSSITRLCFVNLRKFLKKKEHISTFCQVIPERADHIMGNASEYHDFCHNMTLCRRYSSFRRDVFQSHWTRGAHPAHWARFWRGGL